MEPGDVFEGRFEIDRVAGSGGMGDVYRAIDRAAQSPVALKVLQPGRGGAPSSFAERFEREAELLAGIRHPAIVRYVAHGRAAGGRLWLAMEWLDGEDLAARLTKGRLSAAETATLGSRVAEALAAAHVRGVVHRDIKPGNLFLPEGRVERTTVLDFGIARLQGALVSATRTGILLGTPGYMAPEQARGEKQIDARADVFALGAVLFECLTGRPAFAGEHAMALLAKILFEEAPRPSEIDPALPPALDDLVARMLAKSPEGRPRDGAAVARELASLGAAHDPSARRPAILSAPPPALGAHEQQLLSVVLAAPAGAPADAVTAPTILTAEAGVASEGLTTLVAELGGRLEALAGGSLAAVLAGTGPATDLAARAARCALSMRALLPGAPMALTTGRGMVTDRWPVGEALDRAARLLREGAATRRAGEDGLFPIRIDDVTAGLLPARFDVGGDAAGLDLRGEREIAAAARTLLGKPTPCVGREREIALLESTFASACEEPAARVVLVTAPPGAGKSRLVTELLARLQKRDEPFAVWTSRGDPLSAGSPFAMIAPALRRAAGILDGEPLPVRHRKLRARLARHVAERDLDRLAVFLGELTGAPAPDDGGAGEGGVQLRAARRDAVLMGDQMRRAFEDLLAAETAAEPLLLVLEDLHWGDLPSVKFIGAALRNLGDRPWMVLGLARPEVHEIFPDLWSQRELQEVRLRPLAKKGAEQLARQILGPSVEAAAIDRLVERAAGNAFYLEELIRAAADGRGDELPATVLAMAEARIGALTPDARRVLRAASVFGQVFFRGGVAALLGGDAQAPDLGAWLDELTAREIWTERDETRFPGERELAFRHSLVREAGYATLTERDRALGHRLAAEWLAKKGESDAMVLGEHFERGGEPAKAIAWFRRAAEQALGGDDLAAAIARAERAVACGAEGEILGALRALAAEAHGWRGEIEAAAARSEEAMALLAHGSAAWCGAAGEAARALSKLGRGDRLGALVDEARALGEDSVALPEHVALWATMTSHLFTVGLRREAEALLGRIDGAPEARGPLEPAVAATIEHARSWAAVYQEDVAASLRWEEAAVASFERAGDLRQACTARMGLGVAYREVGAIAEAEQALREAAATAERMGLANVLATARHNLGPVLAIRGAFAEARAMEEEAIRALAAQGDARLEGGSRYYLAQILAASGDLDAALAEAERAVAIAGDAREVHTSAHATLSTIHRARGDAAAALAAARVAITALGELGRLEEGESYVRLAWAEALLVSGSTAAAAEALRDARAHLLARAATIGDPTRRASFLALPENARTLALSDPLSA